MTPVGMNPAVAEAVRAELLAIGTKNSRLQRHQRRARQLALTIALIAAAGLSTAAAIVVNHFPGSTSVTPLGGLHSVTHTGTGALELGRAPAGATRVIVIVQCLNSEGSISISSLPQNAGDMGDLGTFYCKDGGRVDSHGIVHPWHMNDASLPAAGKTSITITADPGTRWKVTGQYADSKTTPWGKNAKGQSFGQCNVNGCPDLIGALGTNHKTGFVLLKQMDALRGSGYIQVYESDGTTVIGRFKIGTPSP
jgi:hypothetical protein